MRKSEFIWISYDKWESSYCSRKLLFREIFIYSQMTLQIQRVTVYHLNTRMCDRNPSNPIRDLYLPSGQHRQHNHSHLDHHRLAISPMSSFTSSYHHRCLINDWICPADDLLALVTLSHRTSRFWSSPKPFVSSTNPGLIKLILKWCFEFTQDFFFTSFANVFL